jgi:DTW domain-containing protein YfiP
MSGASEVEDGVVPVAATPDCPHCRKPTPLCVCESVKPIENRLDLLILQHPQEQDREVLAARFQGAQVTAVRRRGMGGR